MFYHCDEPAHHVAVVYVEVRHVCDHYCLAVLRYRYVVRTANWTVAQLFEGEKTCSFVVTMTNYVSALHNIDYFCFSNT